jgi:hypothetical protein
MQAESARRGGAVAAAARLSIAIAYFLKLDPLASHSSPAPMSIELADSTASVAVKQEDANASEKHSPGQPLRFHFASICNNLSLAVCF